MRKYFSSYGIKVLKLNIENDLNTWRDGRLFKSKSVKYDDTEPNAQISRINFGVYPSGSNFISIQFLNYVLANNLKEKLKDLSLEYLDTAEQIEKVIIRFSPNSHQQILDMLAITANEYPTFKAIHEEFEELIFSTIKIDELQSNITFSSRSAPTTMTY